jgi:hypothetical protein
MEANDTALALKPENTGISTIIGYQSIGEATKIATQLKDIVLKQNLFTEINGKNHVHVEGWTTLGAMLGVFPEVVRLERIDKGATIDGYLVEVSVWNKYKKAHEAKEKFVKQALYSKKTMKIIPDEQGNDLRHIDEIKYVAEVVLVTLGGQRIGRAMSMCSNLEEGKLIKDEYSIASMAQTRTVGKAFRLPFSWIMTLAGYAATPFEDREETTLGGDVKEAVEAETVEIKEPVKETKKQEPTTKAAVTPEVVKPTTPDFVVPTSLDEQKKIYSSLIADAKNVGVDVDKFLTDNGWKPPKPSYLPKLLPALAKAINDHMTKLEADI